ncbi:MAG: hypothetical protein IT430_09185 [Phycisphaerales bacterium]|nr:hypothetical protein [Phycisphaerales bacterium]
MTQSQVMMPDRARAGRSSTSAAARYFYAAAAAVMVVLAFLGFSKFYLHGQAYPGREIAPPIRTLVIAHGVAMSAWLILLLVQPLLIVVRKHRVHMALGRVGAALAAAILVLGIWVGIQSARYTPPEAVIWGLSPKRFMAIPLIGVSVFAIFVALGVVYRRKPRIHRAMMITATLSALAAGVSRIDALSNLYVGTAWEQYFGPFLMTMVFAVALWLLRCAVTRSIDRALGIGVASLIAISLLTMQVARTAAWESFASMLVG